MRFFLSVCLFCGIALSSFGQSGNQSAKFSIGAEVGMPLGNYTDVYKIGFGGSLKYEIPAGKDLFFTASAGFINFGYSEFTKQQLGLNNPNSPSAVSFIPVKAGIKYYAEDGFFVEGQLGAALNTKSGGGTAFAYAPGAGYSFDGGLEAGIRYEAWAKNGTFDQFAVRLAYRF